MSLKTLSALALFATLVAAPALAQTDPATAPSDTATQMPAEQSMPADTTSTMPSQAPVTILQSSPTPSDQAFKLVAGAPNTVSNAPIPDTAENRAKYGGPMSNGGKKTPPRGN
jgi:hypothetical protein